MILVDPDTGEYLARSMQTGAAEAQLPATSVRPLASGQPKRYQILVQGGYTVTVTGTLTVVHP